MTSYHPPAVHACPGCDAFFFRQRLRTINFFGVQDWSDGVPTAFWRQEPLVRCPSCLALFWLDDTEEIGVMPGYPPKMGRFQRAWLRWRGDPRGLLREQDDWDRAIASWGRAQYLDRVGFDDVVYVLGRSRGVSREGILWLRKRIWWDLNDRYRSRCDGTPLSGVSAWPWALERRNMEVILDMLRDGEATPRSLTEQGELLRLLGRFDEAVAVLRSVPADGHSECRAVKIESLARRGDVQVRMLRQPSW